MTRARCQYCHRYDDDIERKAGRPIVWGESLKPVWRTYILGFRITFEKQIQSVCEFCLPESAAPLTAEQVKRASEAARQALDDS